MCQSGVEVKAQPFVDFSIDFCIDIILGKAGALHDTFFIVAGVADVELGIFCTAAYTYIVCLLVTGTSPKFILPVSSLYGFVDVQVLPVTIAAILSAN